MHDPRHFPVHVHRACALHNLVVEGVPEAALGVPIGTPHAAPFIRQDVIGDRAANDSGELRPAPTPVSSIAAVELE